MIQEAVDDDKLSQVLAYGSYDIFHHIGEQFIHKTNDNNNAQNE